MRNYFVDDIKRCLSLKGGCYSPHFFEMRVCDTKVFSESLTASHTKCLYFTKMQFVSHCYTVFSYQPILRHSVYKNSAVNLSGARVRFSLSNIQESESKSLGIPEFDSGHKDIGVY